MVGHEGKFVYNEKASARKKKPNYCEHDGGAPKRNMKVYPKPVDENEKRGRRLENQIVPTPRCKGKPYKLVEVVSHHPPGNKNNPYPPESGKWVRTRVWNWFCEDCYLGWKYGVYVAKCPKCHGKFYYSYDSADLDNKGFPYFNVLAAEGMLSCSYCKTDLFKWKKVGDRKRKFERTTKGWKATNEWLAIIDIPKGCTCKKCNKAMKKVADIPRYSKSCKGDKMVEWKVDGWRCKKCGLEVPADEV